MGLIITAEVLCDNCNQTQIALQSADAPLPNGWCRIQGYANISNGDSETINGYFCPACVTAQGTKNLAKKAADVSTDLTSPA